MISYSSQEDYKAKMENSSKWRKANNYEVFGWNICMECRYFKADMDTGTIYHGECSLMAQEGAYNVVVYDAVCNRYVNKRGYNINGGVIDLLTLPKWIPTKTDKKTGKMFVVA